MEPRLRPWVLVAGLNGAMAVGFAAYAAHGLAGDPHAQDLAGRAWLFQILHALALLAADRLPCDGGSRAAFAARLLFTLGIGLFSGSLYVLALTGPLTFPLLTPAGGICLIAGWLALAASAFGLGGPRHQPPS